MTVAPDSDRVRAGWTLPGAVVGLVALIVGWWLTRSVSTAHQLCDVLAFPPSSCGHVNTKLDIGTGLAAGGATLALVAVLVAGRRARAAGRQGQPWPVRRFLDGAAAWIDRRLPGASAQRAQPRVRGGAVGALFACLLFVAAYGAYGAWTSHERSVERAHRHVAEQRLASLVLPHGLTRAGGHVVCGPAVDTLCVTSALSADALRQALVSLLSGSASSTPCDVPPYRGDCPVLVIGTIAGYPALADVSQHLLFVRHGTPPPGAVPASGLPRRSHAYYFGSDITISLQVPSV